jgi:ABC-type oligopeptide transport system substrate-binding subunit
MIKTTPSARFCITRAPAMNRPPRHRPLRLFWTALILVVASIAGLAQSPKEDPKAPAQKNPGNEIEDPRGRVKKRIVVDDEPVLRKSVEAPVGSPPYVRLDELVRAGEEARDPALKSLFAKHAVPFDRVVERSGAMRVQPVPVLKAEWPDEVGLAPLDGAGRPQEVRTVKTADVRTIEYYEAMVVADAENLVKQAGEGTSALDQFAAAEKLLAAALRFHEYARERSYPTRKVPIRSGKGWDELRTSLASKLRTVRVDYLRAALAAKDNARIRDLSSRLMNAYPKDAGVAKEVAIARIGEVERLLQSGNHPDNVRAKELLDELEAKYPGAGGDSARKLRGQLHDLALKAFERARQKKAVGDTVSARDELIRAAALDSTIEGLREMQRELRTGYPILHVGVRQFPAHLSPATARLDSERQVVELLFEGLLEEVPEESGSVRYRPGAAVAMPATFPGGRDFHLRTFEREPSGRPGFDSHDLVGTVKLLRSRNETWPAYPLAWLDQDPPLPRDAASVRLRFAVGHPDPRALLTFKLLPTRWLEENGKAIDDAAFAEKPFGTGPFKLQGRTSPEPGLPREMIFIDNPAYGRWRDRTGLPHLREIRMVEVAKLDPVAAFRDDKLHILTDVPTQELANYTAPGSGLVGKVQVVTSTSNRRVHILAVNLTRPYLQGTQGRTLRQGLSMAIDRDEVLREVFRAGKPDLHKPMTGPFPPNSWAAPKSNAAVPLVNRDLAVAKLRAYLADAGAKTDLVLSYPDDDPRAAAACARIKSQIESLLRDSPRKIIINLDGVSMRDLLVRVQDEHRYDLAYVPFDYPDDWYPFALGAALDPSAAVRGGRNWFSFLTAGTSPDANDQQLGQMLSVLRQHRDPGKLVPLSMEASKAFSEILPFIPLWQLDRHTVIHNNLRIYVDDTNEPANPRVLNPTTLFQGVARWRLE